MGLLPTRRLFNPKRRQVKRNASRAPEQDQALFASYEMARKALKRGLFGWIPGFGRSKEKLVLLLKAVSGHPGLATLVKEALSKKRYTVRLGLFGKRVRREEALQLVDWFAKNSQPNPSKADVRGVLEQARKQLAKGRFSAKTLKVQVALAKKKDLLEQMRDNTEEMLHEAAPDLAHHGE